MLQSNHLSLRSHRHDAPGTSTLSAQFAQRSQKNYVVANRTLEALCDSLPTNLSPNKRAMINRLVALYEQGALG